MMLRKKQKAFVEFYLQSWNATQAAKDAGYSERTAYSIGPRLLKDVEVEAEIQRRLDEICMTSDEVLTSLAEIGRTSIDDIMDVDETGHLSFNFKRAKEEGKLNLIKSVIPTAHGTKVEMHDRMKALELIGRHHELFTDNVDLTTKGKPIEIIEIVKDHGSKPD